MVLGKWVINFVIFDVLREIGIFSQMWKILKWKSTFVYPLQLLHDVQKTFNENYSYKNENLTNCSAYSIYSCSHQHFHFSLLFRNVSPSRSFFFFVVWEEARDDNEMVKRWKEWGHVVHSNIQRAIEVVPKVQSWLYLKVVATESLASFPPLL